jgi:hypothetical protein
VSAVGRLPGFGAAATVDVKATSSRSLSAPTPRFVGISGGDDDFHHPECTECIEVSPGNWERTCLSATGTERVETCAPTPRCGACLPDSASTTGFSADCFYVGGLDRSHFKRPCRPIPPPKPIPWGPVVQCAPCMAGGWQYCQHADDGVFTQPCQSNAGEEVPLFCVPATRCQVLDWPPFSLYCGFTCVYSNGVQRNFLEHWCGVC